MATVMIPVPKTRLMFRIVLPILVSVRSWPEFVAQRQDSADCAADAPLGPLGTSGGPAERGDLPCQALLLRADEHLALPFAGELADEVRVLVHGASLSLIIWRAGPGGLLGAAGNLRAVCCQAALAGCLAGRGRITPLRQERRRG